MLYAGYYNLSSPSTPSSRNASMSTSSRRSSEKSATSTEQQQLPQQPERRKSFLQKVIYQLKPIEQPVLVDGVWSPMFVSKAERQAAEAEAKARKASVATGQKQRGSISKAQYELISAAAGAEFVKTYHDPTTLSGKPLGRAFCSTCGSKLHALTPLREDIISIPAGLLASAHSGIGTIAKETGLDGDSWAKWKPSKEQFCREKAGWVPQFSVMDTEERYVTGTMGQKVGQSPKI
ncbi:uncharacterized protein AB675_1064 [Cyphellophora attinorum]|uniref:CENP-V/GFA domain-containing protein n=1 Tax=Cyphellophora attinorum TaxID=1664694 RepID=A0A0N0NKS0_9EURO|nr:uncharacterized protein AB675_1064 [Phialophora attinorum]KPI38159.1 hypothetical protein AB675_1064 [Phialophora attinorum]